MNDNHGEYKWWLNLNGEVFIVRRGKTHQRWASEYLSKNRIKSHDAGDTLLEMGWIRLILVGTESEIPAGYSENDGGLILGYEYSKSHPPSQKLMKYIKDFAIELGSKSIHNDVIDKIEPLDEIINNLTIESKRVMKKNIKEVGNITSKSQIIRRINIDQGIKLIYQWAASKQINYNEFEDLLADVVSKIVNNIK